MTWLDLVFYSFVVVVCIQLSYLILFSKFLFTKKKENNSSQGIPISVIICAKNEAENLRRFLPHIFEQNYPNYQVVLINDASQDDTFEVMEEFAATFPNVKLVNVENNETFWANKKYALTLGIKAAKHEHLLFTDADCKPVSKNWIKEMSACFSGSQSIVLGYGGYDQIKNSLLNKLIRYETLLTAVQYYSYAAFGMPYMGVGRNLAYTKSDFFRVSGFMSHMKIKSGDDDLFINEAANSNNISLATTPDSFTASQPKTTFKAWINQKRRHISTAKHYQPLHKFLLSVYFVSQIIWLPLAIILFAYLFQWKVVLIIIGVKLIFQLIVFWKASKTFNESGILPFLPFLECFLVITQLSIFITNQISQPKHWK